MTAYFIFLVIVVYCLSVALPAYGCNVTIDEDLKRFEPDLGIRGPFLKGIIGFIDDHQQYEEAIKKIDVDFHTEPWETLDEYDKLDKFSVGLFKCHTFAGHVVCTATKWAYISVVFIRNLMIDLIQMHGNGQIVYINNWLHKLNELVTNLTNYIIYVATLLFNIGYTTPKWLPMLLIYCDDIQEKTSEFYTVDNFINDTKDYLYATAENIIVNFNLSDQCKKIGFFNLLTYDSNSASKLQEEHKRLNDHHKLMHTEYINCTINLFAYDSKFCEKFLIINWLLITPNIGPVIHPHSFNELLIRPKWDWLGIKWNNIMSATSINAFEEKELRNKNWKMNTFIGHYSSKQGDLNQVRQIYRLMIIRLVLVNISECDSLRRAIQPFLKTSEGKSAANLFIKYSAPIKEYVKKAINYLGGDGFMEKLLLDLSTFTYHFGKNVSNIFLGVMEELNSKSEQLKVNAALNHKTEEKNLSSIELFNEYFYDEAQRIKLATLYTEELMELVPTLDFKVANVMQTAANNMWITALPAF